LLLGGIPFGDQLGSDEELLLELDPLLKGFLLKLEVLPFPVFMLPLPVFLLPFPVFMLPLPVFLLPFPVFMFMFGLFGVLLVGNSIGSQILRLFSMSIIPALTIDLESPMSTRPTFFATLLRSPFPKRAK
jgi:hypothetical protein